LPLQTTSPSLPLPAASFSPAQPCSSYTRLNRVHSCGLFCHGRLLWQDIRFCQGDRDLGMGNVGCVRAMFDGGAQKNLVGVFRRAGGTGRIPTFLNIHEYSRAEYTSSTPSPPRTTTSVTSSITSVHHLCISYARLCVPRHGLAYREQWSK
jgi:hypothetical protein